MRKDEILNLIKMQIGKVDPELENYNFQISDQMKALGLNSVDRAEVIMMTMEALSINSPIVDFAKAENIGGLVDIFYEKIQ